MMKKIFFILFALIYVAMNVMAKQVQWAPLSFEHKINTSTETFDYSIRCKFTEAKGRRLILKINIYDQVRKCYVKASDQALNYIMDGNISALAILEIPDENCEVSNIVFKIPYKNFTRTNGVSQYSAVLSIRDVTNSSETSFVTLSEQTKSIFNVFYERKYVESPSFRVEWHDEYLLQTKKTLLAPFAAMGDIVYISIVPDTRPQLAPTTPQKTIVQNTSATKKTTSNSSTTTTTKSSTSNSSKSAASSSNSSSSVSKDGTYHTHQDYGSTGSCDMSISKDGTCMSVTTIPCYCCGGTGFCSNCHGQKYVMMGYSLIPCIICSMTGRCNMCGGTCKITNMVVGNMNTGLWTGNSSSGWSGSGCIDVSGGGSSSYSSSSSSSSSSSTSSSTSRPYVEKKVYAPKYVADPPKEWCDICKCWDYTHSHVKQYY